MAVPSGTKASFIECRITLDEDLSWSRALNATSSVIRYKGNHPHRAGRSGQGRCSNSCPRTPQAKASDAPQLWECLRSEPCGEPCHLPSSAGNTVATVNDENPCGDRGLDAVCPSLALDGTKDEKWRRRESNPRPVIPQKRPLRAYSVDWSHCRRFYGQDTTGS